MEEISNPNNNVSLSDEQPNVISPPPRKKNRLIILVISILFIGFIGGLFYYLNIHKSNPTKNSLSQKTNVSPVLPTPTMATFPIISSQVPTATVSITPQTSQVACKPYKNQYFQICYPNSWEFREETNKGPNEIALFGIGDGKPFGEGYAIHVLQNPTGENAMLFAKNDMATNWKPVSVPTYSTYPLNNLDAVEVNNIDAGKGTWGPSVYIVNKTLAVQIISENLLKNPNQYFNPLISTFSFSNNQ
ncbi:MAG TPA: hypothetical protein VLF93_00600 [Candidatus Saccharimonadales bacterium]|nr:hypothetical protein [Candidatus Saccharimonadales bacterium]